LALGLVLALLLAFASAVLMSLGADEAFILSSVQGLAERGEFAHRHGLGAATTGGLHTVAEFLLYLVAGNSLPLLRLFPLLCLGLLLREIFAWSRQAGLSRPAAWLAGTVLIAVPGTLTLAGSAFGAVPATLLTIAGIRLWDPIGGGSRKRRWLSAAVLGLAAATRVQCVAVFPALVAGSITRAWPRRSDLVSGVLGLLLGVAVLAACYGGLLLITPGAGTAVSVAQQGAGLGLEANAPILMAKLLSANRFLPLPLLAGATLLAAWLGRVGFDTRERLRALIWFGWLSWASWIVIAPIPHLRYLWPGLAAFSCVLGFGLGQLYQRGQLRDLPALRIGALLIGITCLATGCGSALRHIVVGDLNLVTWEWREFIARGSAGYGHLRQQAKMADYLRRLPPQERVGVLDHPVELEFLSGRPLDEIGWHLERWSQSGEPPPRRILATPHLGKRVYLPPEAWRWLRSNCELEVRFGAHQLFRVVGEYPSKIGVLRPSNRQGGAPRVYRR
jgi:hypothetical protein